MNDHPQLKYRCIKCRGPESNRHHFIDGEAHCHFMLPLHMNKMGTDGFEPPSSGLEPEMLAINTMSPNLTGKGFIHAPVHELPFHIQF